MKQGRKFWIALIWGAALVGVLVLLLLTGVKSDVVIGAWLAAFVAIPVQFGIANAAISRKFAGVQEAQSDQTMGVVG